MAEERIIDDEYGRGVKLRKTKEGYVDVTDELAKGEEIEEAGEEISFAFPMMEEDDEDLVGLTPEEAEELRKQKAEAAKLRREEYERAVAEGEKLLSTDSFHAAELKFEQALQLDDPATAASVGYWRAKTANFTNPDVLIAEYAEAGIESLEYDLGYEAVEQIRKDYRERLENRYQELKREEEPLSMEVFGKQERRRALLKVRRKNRLIAFGVSAGLLLLSLTLLLVFGLKNFSTPDNTYVPATIALAAVSVVLFVIFAYLTNKLINTLRIYRTNEKLSSTEEGERLSEIMEYIDLYEQLLEIQPTEE